MYATIIVLVLMISGLSTATSDHQSSSSIRDLFVKALIKTIETPISFDETKSKFSLEIMLANDVFNLDDALRLFIQQFLLALYDHNHHLLPEDWQTQFPAYGKVIEELNKILDLLDERTLSKISMRDIRSFIKTLTPAASADLQRLINTLEEEAAKENKAKDPSNEEL